MKRASLLGAALFALSCGVSPSTTTPDTYADFLKLSSQLSCEARLRCCGTVCNPTTDAAFYMTSLRVFDYLNAGLLGYNRDAAVDCLAALQTRYASCDAAIYELPPTTVCSNVLAPQASIGGMCETGINSCGPNAVCSNVSCTVRRTTGQPCSPALSTTPCVNAADSCCTTCTGVCSANIPIGQTCILNNSASVCQSGSFCPPTVLKCTAYAEFGQPCMDVKLECNPKSGLVCLPANQTCGLPQANGSFCTSSAQCMSAYCQLPSLPSPSQGTCQPQPAPMTVRQQLCQTR